MANVVSTGFTTCWELILERVFFQKQVFFLLLRLNYIFLLICSVPNELRTKYGSMTEIGFDLLFVCKWCKWRPSQTNFVISQKMVV
jgi:hypothetical protein